MLRASIDLGTNTCLLLIAERNPKDSSISQVRGDYAQIVRLGQGVDQERRLHPEAMDRTLNCLKEYSERVRQVGLDPSNVVCVATSQARDAKNSQEFFSRVKKETGFQFRVISGDEEARSTFLGSLLPGMNPKTSSVIDIGGGSTEMISWENAQSVDLGSVRYTERFFKSNPVTDEEFWACQDAIDSSLQSFTEWRRKAQEASVLVAVAGTATTLAAWHLGLEKFDSQKVDGHVLTRGDIHRMVEELKWRTLDERKKLPGMEPLRADVLLAGALVLWRVLEVLQFPECVVSTRGLRYGVLISSFD